jgi:hypothetical protein
VHYAKKAEPIIVPHSAIPHTVFRYPGPTGPLWVTAPLRRQFSNNGTFAMAVATSVQVPSCNLFGIAP